MPLTPDSFLEVGLSFVLYYPFDNEAEALQTSVQSSFTDLKIDPSYYEIEHATSASSVIYVHILRQLTSYDIKRLLATIEETSGTDHRVTISREHEVYEAVERQGMHHWLRFFLFFACISTGARLPYLWATSIHSSNERAVYELSRLSRLVFLQLWGLSLLPKLIKAFGSKLELLATIPRY